MSERFRQALVIVSDRIDRTGHAETVGWLPHSEWRAPNVAAIYDPVMARCDKCGTLLALDILRCDCGGEPR